MEWLVASPERMTDEMVEIRLRLYAVPGDPRVDEEDVPHRPADGPDEVAFTEDDVRSFKPETLVFWTEHNPGQGPDYGEYWRA